MFDAASLLFGTWQLAKLFGVASISTGIVTGYLFAVASDWCDSNKEVFSSKNRRLQSQRLQLVTDFVGTLATLKVYAKEGDYSEPLLQSAEALASNARWTAAWTFLSAMCSAMVSESFLIIGVFASVFMHEEGHPNVNLETFLVAQAYVAYVRTCVSDIAQGWRALKVVYHELQPIEAFLSEPERENKSDHHHHRVSSDCRVSDDDDDDDPQKLTPSSAVLDFELPDVSGSERIWKAVLHLETEALRFRDGELVIVSGPVGSGKVTTLLACLPCRAYYIIRLTGALGDDDASLLLRVLCCFLIQVNRHSFWLCWEKQNVRIVVVVVVQANPAQRKTHVCPLVLLCMKRKYPA